MLQYILECIAFQLVFLIIYDVFLKRETFFQWNRLYLIGTYIISMVLPWVKIEAMKTTVPESFQAYPEFLWSMNNTAVVTAASQEPTFSISWEYALLFGGMLLSALFFGYKLYQIYALRQKGEVQYFKDFTRIIITNSSMAFSFFKSIFLGDKVIEKEHENILQHELVHIRQRHSYDLIFFELMRIVGWFNPLVYVYQSRVSELHEFIADDHVAKTHKKEQYQLLLSEVFQTQHISFINQFFKSSLIKKRIVMLSKEKSKKIYQLKYLLLLPLVFGMLAYTSFESKIENVVEENSSYHSNMLVDKNLKILVNQRELSIRKVEKEDKNLGPGEFVHVDNIKDLTGDEIRKVNQLLDNIDFDNRILFISDDRHAFLISKIKSSEENTAEESKELISQQSDPEPFATVDEVPVFPGCEDASNKRACFNENMQRHIAKNFNYPKEAQEKGIQGRVSVMFIITKKGKIEGLRMRGPDSILEKEVERIIGRLPKMKPGKHKGKKVDVPFSIPITFKLNSDGPDYQILPEIDTSDEDVINSIRQYNQLVAERKRLLLSANKTNPIIVNLDQQLDRMLEALKTKVQQSDTSQKELEVQFLKILKEREKLKINQLQLETEDVPFSTVDNVPVFPGCEDDDNKRNCFTRMIQKHIAKNFNYPLEAQEKGIQGRVSIMFTVSKDGSIQNVRMRGPDALLEKEAARIIGLLPKMTPGKHKGKTVNVPFSIPITFKLQVETDDLGLLKIASKNNIEPLIIIDDAPSTKKKMTALNPDDIESISVLKDEAAEKKYGAKGKNGVVEITTKKKD